MINKELLEELKLDLYKLMLFNDSTKGDLYFDGFNNESIEGKSLGEVIDYNFPDSFWDNELVKPLKLEAKKRKSAAKIKREREIRKLKREIRKAEEERLAQEEKQRAEEAARAEEERIKTEKEEAEKLEKLQEEWEKEEKRKEKNTASQDSLNFALHKFMKGEAKFYKGKLYIELFGVIHVWYIKGKKLIARQINNNNCEGYIKGKEYIEKYHSYFLPKEVK